MSTPNKTASDFITEALKDRRVIVAMLFILFMVWPGSLTGAVLIFVAMAMFMPTVTIWIIAGAAVAVLLALCAASGYALMAGGNFLLAGMIEHHVPAAPVGMLIAGVGYSIYNSMGEQSETAVEAEPTASSANWDKLS